MHHADERDARSEEVFKRFQISELVDIDDVGLKMFARLELGGDADSTAKKEAMPKRILPGGFAFAGARAVEQAYRMAAVFEGGCSRKNVCFRPAERAKFFVNEQYFHTSSSLPPTASLKNEGTYFWRF